MSSRWPCLLALCVLSPLLGGAQPPVRTLRYLFLGDQGHHRPAERYRQLAPVLAERGIELEYTERLADLNPQKLAGYDGLVIYANHSEISPEQERALLEFVAGGKGLAALHCASYCFLNSPAYIELVGAQFKEHGAGVFRTTIGEPEHPLVRGYGGFESWDETYVHHRHNDQGRTVLEYREEAGHREPWTWVRTHGRGRVFYTAWGHDQQTWGHPGFHNLVERGLRWAAGDDPTRAGPYSERPQMTPRRTDVQPFEYVAAEVPFYPAGKQWGTLGEPIRQMQVPLPPHESLKHVVTPVGFEVRLFVSEPDLKGKPIAMNWDERGRLWVLETVDYPNDLQPAGRGHDRIRICEDTDGDERADRFTVFAEGLSIPTSLVFARGGVIVQQAPHTLFLRDTDGDDVADERQVLFSGWGTSDTHAGPSNLQWGLDNWIYGIVGYSGFDGTVGGERLRFGSGFYRFLPDGSRLEFLRSTNNNSWGLGISEEGILFGSTANGNPSEYMPLANRYYEQVRGWAPQVLGGIAASDRFEAITDRVRQVDNHGGFTAAAGHALYTARAYPREYWNRAAFVCEPTGHLAATFLLRPRGAGFSSHNAWNLLASDDEWTAPIAAEVGPDGHVWVIDWYNYIVQHNPTPAGYRTGRGNAYETQLRDKQRGRIWRIVYTAAPPQAQVQLSVNDPAGLVAALRHPNMFWRKHAQRLLVERGQRDVVPELIKLVSDPAVDELGLNPAAMHALWTLHGLRALDGSIPEALSAVAAALGHRSAGVRRNAVLVMAGQPAVAQAILEHGLLADPDGQVRLAALAALADTPPKAPAAAEEGDATSVQDRVAAALVSFFVEQPNLQDRWLADAATSAAAQYAESFLLHLCRWGAATRGGQQAPTGEAAAARSGQWAPAGQAAATRGALQTPTGAAPAARNGEQDPAGQAARVLPPRLVERVQIVAEHLARGGRASLAQLLDAAAASSPEIAAAVIAGLDRGWPTHSKPDSISAAALQTLFDRLPTDSRAVLVRLAARWGSDALADQAHQLAESLKAAAADEALSADERLAAIRQLAAFGADDPNLAASLLELLSARTSPELAAGLFDALAASRAPQTGAAIAEALPGLTPAVRAAALRSLLTRAEWTAALLDSAEAGLVSLDELALDQKQALANHPDRALARRAKKLLERSGGLPDPDRQRVIDALAHLATQRGDPQAGREVFKKHCSKCHTHSGEGTRIGPDLTGMAVHPKIELLTQILDPSRSVEGNYRIFTLVTDSGRVLSGLLVGETRTTLEVVDSEGKRHVVLREELESLAASPKSLMPEGFEKQIQPEELANLLEFLTQRGKYLPLPLEKVATVVSTRGMFYSEDAPVERLVFEDWGPKTVEGVPFVLVDPQGARVPNAIMLYGPQGVLPPRMPRSVTVPCNAAARAIHVLGGVSGWGFPLGNKGSVSMIVRLHYAGGAVEDHPLRNGEHLADYIRRVDVPGSKFAFDLRGRQVRYLAIIPERDETIASIELIKGDDATAPVVMALTVELP